MPFRPRLSRHAQLVATATSALLATTLLLSACSSECTEDSPCWDNVVASWGRMPVESVCLRVDETWYKASSIDGADLATVEDRGQLERLIDDVREERRLAPEWPGTWEEPLFREDLEGDLESMDLHVVESGCDATLALDIVGVPVASEYEVLIDLKPTGVIRSAFNGALIVADVRLEAAGRESLVGDAHAYKFGRGGTNTDPGESVPADIDYPALIHLPFWDWIDSAARY